MPKKSAGIYYEDFAVGEEYETAARTITEADIVNYCAFTGDWNPLHCDEEFAKKSIFGSRIAHGPLVAAVAGGLITRLGLFEATAVAFLGSSWRFLAPVRIGDTIHSVLKVAAKRETSKPGRGIVNFTTATFNQRGEVLVEGTWDMMMHTKPPAG